MCFVQRCATRLVLGIRVRDWPDPDKRPYRFALALLEQIERFVNRTAR